jgi:hypothetical protein
MKTATLRFVAVLALPLCLLLAGCHKKKPPVPQQANAPTIQPATQPTTAPVPPPATTTTTPTTTPPPPQPTPPKPAAKKTKTHAEKKTPPPANTAKNHTVVNEAGTTENKVPQISAGTTDGHLQQSNTAQLLEATDNNLKSLHRQLTPDEQAMVQQIQDFEKQSREATVQGDTVRAYNLALKAHLLSDELAHK